MKIHLIQKVSLKRHVKFVFIFHLGVDSVGTVPSSLLTYAAGVALQPNLIINAGTAGGFQVTSLFFSIRLFLHLLLGIFLFRSTLCASLFNMSHKPFDQIYHNFCKM